MTKIAKAAADFARYIACKPHVWGKPKKDKYGGMTRQCTKCKVRETSYPDGITTRWQKQTPKVTARR